MPSDALTTYGPTLTQLEALKAAEKQRRKRIRMLQVQTQARQNAARTRELYELKRKCLVGSVARELQEVYDRAALDDLRFKQEEYNKVLDQTGAAHLLADAWEDPKIEIERQTFLARQSADRRAQLAAHALREAQAEQRAREEEPRVRLRSVRELEDERAALVAALPKPPTVDELFASNHHPAPEPTVLVYDVAARNAVHTERAPSGVAVTRTDMTNTSANNDSAPAQNAAAAAAQIESERLQALEHEQCLRMRESEIKADLRGQHAMKRERVRRHYSTLMARLDELGRGDAARLRHQLGQGGPGVGTTNDLINRKLEKVFEDEVLRQLAEQVPRDQDDLMIESITNEAGANENSENQLVQRGVISETVPVVASGIGDRRNRPALIARDNRPENFVHSGESASLSDISAPIGSRGIAWSISAEDEYSSAAMMPSCPAQSQVERDESTQHPGDPAVLVPDTLIAVAAEPPGPTSAPIGGLPESTLGPGERPELPSLRARHRSARSRESRAVLPNELPANYTHRFLDSVLDRPEYAPPAILQLTPAPERTDANSSAAQSERSYSQSLSEQQELLDRELAEIDRRIARIRMGTVDAHEPDSTRSAVSGDSVTSMRQAVTTETILASQASTRKIPPLTPRDSVVVEGQAVGEYSDRNPREANSLKETQSNSSHQSDSQREPISANRPQQSSKPESIAVCTKPSLSPLPPTWMQKLSSIISAQVREAQSACRSGCSSRSSGSTVDRSSVRSSSTQSASVAVEPGEEGDTLSRIAAACDSSTRSQPLPLVPEKTREQQSSSIVPEEKSFDQIPAVSASEFSVLSTTEPHRTEPESKTTECKQEEEDSFPTELHSQNHEAVRLPTPRLSLSRFTNSEVAVLRSIGQIASRLAQTALREASDELAMNQTESTAHSVDSDQPRSPTDVPPRQPDASVHPVTDEAYASSDNRSSTSRTTASSEGLSTTHSLKQELRAILTSSLISSLLSGTTPSSLNGALSTTSEALKRLLGSSCSSRDPSTNKIVTERDRPSGDLSDSSDLQFESSAPTGISGPLSSPSTNHPRVLDVASTVIACESAAAVVPSSPEVAWRSLDLTTQSDQTLSSQNVILPTDSSSDPSRLVKVNKDWLLSLVGSENLKNSQSQSHSSCPWFRSSAISEPASLRKLSPTDLILDTTKTPEVSGNIHQYKSPSSTGSPVHCGRGQRSSVSSSCTTSSTHLFSFKPLPRLDEAPSEESIPDLPTTQLASVDPLEPCPLIEGETLQTPSTSWSDSRKSNEFRHLSRCQSTSNSNLNSVSGSMLLHGTPQDDASLDGVRCTNGDEDDQTTIHRLRTDLPQTPVEPREALVVPCLGSLSLAPFPAGSSAPTPETSSSIDSQPSADDDLSWVPLPSGTDRLPLTPTMNPTVLANVTRNTTTIDSSIVWDDGETLPVVNQAGLASNDLELLSPTRISTRSRSPAHEIECPAQSKATSPRLECLAKSPRPLSPADGAPAGSSPCLQSCGFRDPKLTPFASMPTIYVDCETEVGTRAESRVPFRSINGALYASWSSFNHVPKPPTDPPSSLSDSLRSFQRHEASCCLLDDEADLPEASCNQVVSRVPQHDLLSQAPGDVSAPDVHPNATAIRAAARKAGDSQRSSTVHRMASSSTGRQAWNSLPANRAGHSTRGSIVRGGGGTGVRVARSSYRTAHGPHRLHSNCVPAQSTPPDPLEIAMSNVTVEGVQPVKVVSTPKKKVDAVRQTNASRGCKTRSTSLHNVRSRYLSSARRPHVPTADPIQHASTSGSRVQISGAKSRHPCEQPVQAAPTNVTNPRTSSLIHSSSTSLEQSLCEQLRRWREVRLGTRHGAFLFPVVTNDPLLTGATVVPQLPATTSVSTATGAGSSTAAPTMNGSIPSCSLSLIERVDFASVLPGPPPLVVERNADEDMSSTTLWMNEVAFQPPATLNPRPSSPTPNTADRRLTSSDNSGLDDEDINVATEADNSTAQGPHWYSGRAPYRQLNRGSVAFVVDFDALAPPSTACAGDELANERRFPLNELHFTTAPFRGRAGLQSNRMAGLNSNDAQSTVLQEPHTEVNSASRATVRQQPSEPVAAPEPPVSSRPKAPDSRQTGTFGIGHSKRRAVQTPEQKHRDEQARLNRLRVKEFDRIRRERALRRKKKATA